MAHAEDMRLSLGLMAALAFCLPLAAQKSNPPLRVVESVDLTRYAGRWYEAARLPNRFQDQCTGDVVVHYALRTDGRIDVVNRCRTSACKVDEARGVGRKAGDQHPSPPLHPPPPPLTLRVPDAAGLSECHERANAHQT